MNVCRRRLAPHTRHPTTSHIASSTRSPLTVVRRRLSESQWTLRQAQPVFSLTPPRAASRLSQPPSRCPSRAIFYHSHPLLSHLRYPRQIYSEKLPGAISPPPPPPPPPPARTFFLGSSVTTACVVSTMPAMEHELISPLRVTFM